MVMTPVSFEQQLHPGDEVVHVRHVGEHVVAEQQIGPLAFAHQLARGLGAEEADPALHPLLAGGRGGVARRFDAQDRHAVLHEVLQ